MKRKETPASNDTKAPAKPRKKPMEEGIQRTRRPRGFFKKMSDGQLVEYAKAYIKKKKISEKKKLETVDEGLYDALRKRKLLDRVGFEEKQRPWRKMSHGELVAFAKEFMREKGIRRSKELEDADQGLYDALRKRKLLGRVGFEKKPRPWDGMSDEELVAHAKKFVEKKRIKRKAELRKTDNGLYNALWRRKLLDKVGFERKQNSWKKMSDDELVAFAKRFMKEKGISGKTELRRTYKGLYEALRRRKLLDQVGFKEKQRDWASTSDDDIVAYAKKFMKEKKIIGRRELWEADEGLYYVLLRRKLLDKVGFEEKQRSWKEMADEELVAFAKRYMKDKGINEKAELRKTDNGLYNALLRRKLLDKVGFEKKQRKKSIEKPVKIGRSEKKEDNAMTEIERIVMRREELISHGMDDKEIAKQIAKEMKKRPETIGFFIYRIVNNKGGVKNSNNHKVSDDK